MGPVPPSPSSYRNSQSVASRATSFGLALLLVALVVLMMLRLGLLPDRLPSSPGGGLAVVNVEGPHPSHSATKLVAVAKARTVTKAAPRPTRTIPPPKVPPPPIPWNVTPMTHDEFAASDISTKPDRSAERGAAVASADAGSGADGGDGNGSGGGQGDRLYNADWYPRPPTQAEMSFYLQHTAGGQGWGEIACKTAPRYTVVDCRELGETPGSGFAHALREAAWQFHVLPPRVNGRALVGSWVRIHFDFTPEKGQP